MTKLVPLLSKKFTDNQCQNEFVAAASKLTLIVENRENVQNIQLHLKGRKGFIPVTSFYSPSSCLENVDLIKGETYRLIAASAGASQRSENGTFVPSPSIVEVSGYWGAE
jgi:hypothetical protein